MFNAGNACQCDAACVSAGDCCADYVASCQTPPPAGWTCAAAQFDDGQCDCGCGAEDVDCAPGAVVDDCERCTNCDGQAACAAPTDVVDLDDLTQCAAPPVPTLPAGSYFGAYGGMASLSDGNFAVAHGWRFDIVDDNGARLSRTVTRERVRLLYASGSSLRVGFADGSSDEYNVADPAAPARVGFGPLTTLRSPAATLANGRVIGRGNYDVRVETADAQSAVSLGGDGYVLNADHTRAAVYDTFSDLVEVFDATVAPMTLLYEAVVDGPRTGAFDGDDLYIVGAGKILWHLDTAAPGSAPVNIGSVQPTSPTSAVVVEGILHLGYGSIERIDLSIPGVAINLGVVTPDDPVAHELRLEAGTLRVAGGPGYGASPTGNAADLITTLTSDDVAGLVMDGADLLLSHDLYRLARYPTTGTSLDLLAGTPFSGGGWDGRMRLTGNGALAVKSSFYVEVFNLETDSGIGRLDCVVPFSDHFDAGPFLVANYTEWTSDDEAELLVGDVSDPSTLTEAFRDNTTIPLGAKSVMVTDDSVYLAYAGRTDVYGPDAATGEWGLRDSMDIGAQKILRCGPDLACVANGTTLVARALSDFNTPVWAVNLGFTPSALEPAGDSILVAASGTVRLIDPLTGDTRLGLDHADSCYQASHQGDLLWLLCGASGVLVYDVNSL